MFVFHICGPRLWIGRTINISQGHPGQCWSSKIMRIWSQNIVMSICWKSEFQQCRRYFSLFQQTVASFVANHLKMIAFWWFYDVLWYFYCMCLDIPKKPTTSPRHFATVPLVPDLKIAESIITRQLWRQKKYCGFLYGQRSNNINEYDLCHCIMFASKSISSRRSFAPKQRVSRHVPFWLPDARPCCRRCSSTGPQDAVI